MKAIVTKAFPGVPDGELHVRHFVEGDEVTGKLAQVALDNDWAEEEAGDTIEGEAASLSKLKVDELRALAADRGIDVSAAKTKADIVALLNAPAA